MVFSCFSCLCRKQNIADAPPQSRPDSPLTTRVQAAASAVASSVPSAVASNMRDTFDCEMRGPRPPPSLSPVLSPETFFASPPEDISDES